MLEDNTITLQSVISQKNRESNEDYALRKLLAAVVESSDDAILSKNMNGTILTWNKAAERLYGYTAEEIVGKSVAILMPSEKKDEFLQIMNKLKRGEKIEHYLTKRISKYGKQLDVSVTISPIKDEHDNVIGASAIARDVTETETQKNEFISIASHELKTPITSIKAYAQILQRKLEKKGDKDSAEFLKRMDKQLNKLTYLIRDLLDVSKIQQGKNMLKKEDVNIDDLVDEAIEVIAPLAPDKHISKTGSIQKPVWADRYQIIQVLINFINNAIRYGPQSCEIIIHLSEDDDQVTVGIQDFGVGISPQYQRKIFERFYRVAKKNDTNFTGLGVGLYISSEIIKSHKGKVWVDSTVGLGSTFYFSLPKKTKRKRKKKTV